MKNFNKIWGIGLLVALLSLVIPSKSMAQGGYISDQEFYDELAPYGTWISDPEYGNVWIPDADQDFRPYATRGHWVITDYGNTWVSDYEWGWAPFHYGRWRYDDYYGWEWIPGHEWAPAWVCWRHGGGYYGWAPLRPGISISISIGGGYDAPDYYWTCAPQAYITSPVIYNYYVPRTRSVTIIRNTTVINNTYVRNNVTYISGPRVQEVRQVTNNNVRVYNINNASRPGVASISRNTVNIYRPAVQKAPDARPARVVDASAYRNEHPNERIANGGGFNRPAAARLATVARSSTPDNKVVRVNESRPAPGQPANRVEPSRPNAAQPNRPNQAQPGNRPEANKPNQPNGNRVQQQQADQQRQQMQQQRQQQVEQQRQQQPRQQPAEQQRQQQPRQQQGDQQRQQQQVDQQRQQQADQQRQQQQADQRRQQQQRQQQADQQRQQQMQQRQQQQAQQRQQQMQQQRQQQQQQRQQQQEQQRQQRQQPEKRPNERR